MKRFLVVGLLLVLAGCQGDEAQYDAASPPPMPPAWMYGTYAEQEPLPASP